MIYKSETLFELMQIEVQCSKKNLRQETGAFGNKIEIEKEKPHPELKKICILNYREYFLCLQSSASGRVFFCKNINFVEQQSQIFSL